MTLPALVESTSDVWGTRPLDSNSEFSEQLPRSTYAPPPVDVAPLDYDDMMEEILRLEIKVRRLRMQITRTI
jgi:hypothetical protein